MVHNNLILKNNNMVAKIKTNSLFVIQLLIVISLIDELQKS